MSLARNNITKTPPRKLDGDFNQLLATLNNYN